jgi:hypothetical protein
MMRRSTEIAKLNRDDLVSKVTDILQVNKGGLTSLQIMKLMQYSMPRNILSQLQKEGIIRRNRGTSIEGKVTFLYILNDRRAK